MSHPQLLILESDHTLRTQLCHFLSEQFQIQAFDNSQDALLYLEEQVPDVCLLSVSPSVSLILTHIQTQDLNNWTSVMLLADVAQLNDPAYQSLLASHDYLLKPFVPQDLVFRLKKCLTVPQVDALLLTNDEEVRLECESVLLKEGLTMMHIAHFSRFLSFIGRSTYKFLIVDIRMPGFQQDAFFLALSDWRAIVPQLLVIASSAPSQASSAALFARADDFVTVPFTAIDLQARLHRICSHFANHGLYLSSSEQDTTAIENWLSKVGIKLHTPPALDQTLTMLENGHYDVIFWDSEQLPSNAGELLTAIQRLYPSVPILFICTPEALTAHTKLILKATDYVVAPLNEERFLLRLQRLLSAPAAGDLTSQSELPFEAPIAINPVSEPIPTPHVSVVSPVEMTMGEREALMDQIRVGLNHEIRNPLTSILIGAQALSRRFSAPSEERDIVVEIEKASKRIKGILNAMGNMEKYVVEDYVGNIKMLSFTAEKKND